MKIILGLIFIIRKLIDLENLKCWSHRFTSAFSTMSLEIFDYYPDFKLVLMKYKYKLLPFRN